MHGMLGRWNGIALHFKAFTSTPRFDPTLRIILAFLRNAGQQLAIYYAQKVNVAALLVSAATALASANLQLASLRSACVTSQNRRPEGCSRQGTCSLHSHFTVRVQHASVLLQNALPLPRASELRLTLAGTTAGHWSPSSLVTPCHTRSNHTALLVL